MTHKPPRSSSGTVTVDVLFLCVYVVRAGAEWDMGRDGTAGAMQFQDQPKLQGCQFGRWLLTVASLYLEAVGELAIARTASPLYNVPSPQERLLTSCRPMTPLLVIEHTPLLATS